MTHCDLVAILSEAKPIHIGLKQRFCKFAVSLFEHGSETVQCVARLALDNSMSTFSNNYNSIIGREVFSIKECIQKLYQDWYQTVPEDLRCKAGVLRDLIDIKNGSMHCPTLGPDEITFMLHDICVN